MSGRQLAALALVVLTAVGCAGAGPASSPRARCLSDPRETDTRPLVFLFCVESP
ncbi:MAG: hypothetical protein ACRDH5_03675 [bacterium]